MTKKEKEIFANELIENVRQDILKKIPLMPDAWDGIELREYIAEKFNGITFKGTLHKGRRKDYKNFVLVNNL